MKEILNLATSPLVVPDDGCSHTQPVERLIKKITKASDTVFSAARREQYVRAQETSSALIGEGKTKEDFGKIVNSSLNFTFKYRNSSRDAPLQTVKSKSAPPCMVRGGHGGR